MANRRFVVSRIFIFLSLAVASCQTGGADPQMGQRWEALLQPALDYARQNKVPLGIIASREQLCEEAPSAAKPPSQKFDQEYLRAIASLSGGSTTPQDGVLEVVIGGPPSRLVDALNFQFPSFPDVEGTAPYFGALLGGWLKSTIPTNKGFALDVASSPDEPVLHISRTSQISVRQIADKVVRLGSGGAWLAIDSSDRTSDPERRMLLTIEGYEGSVVNKSTRLSLSTYC